MPLSDLHNSVSESGAKTMQTGQANKHYRQVLFTVSQWFSNLYLEKENTQTTQRPAFLLFFRAVFCVRLDVFDLLKLYVCY